MLLGKDYKVELDRMNIILYRKHIHQKTGNEVWDVDGYFYDFRELLKWLADAEVKGTGLADLKKMAQKQDDIYRLISGLKKITPDQIPVNNIKTGSTAR